MSDVVISNLKKASEGQYLNGLYLLIIHADKVPPHLGMLSEGKYYSILTSGRIIAEDSKSLLRIIGMKKIPTLFLQIKTSNDSSPFLTSIFERYDKVDEQQTTCLMPIKHFFDERFNLDIEKVSYVFDLVPKLQENELIGQAFHLNLDGFIENGSYKLRTYTMKDIQKRIEDLLVQDGKS